MRRNVENETTVFGDLEINVSISVGIATSNDNDNSCNGESLYRHADKAVYHSKETGRNKVTHYDDLDDSDNFQEPQVLTSV